MCGRDTDTHSDGYRNRHGYSNSDVYSNTNGNVHAYSYGYSNGYIYSDTNSHGHLNANSNTDSDNRYDKRPNKARWSHLLG